MAISLVLASTHPPQPSRLIALIIWSQFQFLLSYLAIITRTALQVRQSFKAIFPLTSKIAKTFDPTDSSNQVP